MLARGLPLSPPGVGKGSTSPTASTHRVSQETGSVTYINHVPEGGTEELHSCSRHFAVLRRFVPSTSLRRFMHQSFHRNRHAPQLGACQPSSLYSFAC